MCRTASPSRSSRRCWRCLPARPGRDGSASSCSGSTTPAGTPHRTWSCPRASGSFTCPATPPSFSRPSTSGPSSTSRSPTATSRPSPISSEPSQTVAGSSLAISSVWGQTSTGGPSQPSRPNQPEFVSLAILLVADLLHPLDVLAVDAFLDGDVAHAVRRGRAVPVLHARRRPDHVARLDLPLLTVPFLHPASAGRDDQDLARRMAVPRRARARLEGHVPGRERGLVGRPELRVYPDRAG